jgi:hypothetical protein
MIGKDKEGNGCVLIEMLSLHLPGGTEQNLKNLSSDTWRPADIRREHVPNTSMDILPLDQRFDGTIPRHLIIYMVLLVVIQRLPFQ